MSNDDLYSAEIPESAFRTPCGGNIGGSLESCVSFAEIPGKPGTMALRDSKLGAASPTLMFTATEWAAFMDDVSGTGASA